MKLFEKYLLACTNQRIPMPEKWQESLGLHLSELKQEQAATGSEITGYRFQQDETIDRGFVHREVRSLELDEQAKYLIGLYLNAIKEHKGTDFTPYFNLGVTTYQFPYYTTVAAVIRDEEYTIYGNSLSGGTIKLLSSFNREVISEEQFSMLSTINPLYRKINIPAAEAKSEQGLLVQAIDEYLILEIKAQVPVVILQGHYAPLPLDTNKGSDFIFSAKLGSVEKFFPSVGAQLLEYADKLLPLLTDMTITKNSPVEEKELVGVQYYGDDFEDKVKKNTSGLYDVDKFIGGKFLW